MNTTSIINIKFYPASVMLYIKSWFLNLNNPFYVGCHFDCLRICLNQMKYHWNFQNSAKHQLTIYMSYVYNVYISFKFANCLRLLWITIQFLMFEYQLWCWFVCLNIKKVFSANDIYTAAKTSISYVCIRNFFFSAGAYVRKWIFLLCLFYFIFFFRMTNQNIVCVCLILIRVSRWILLFVVLKTSTFLASFFLLFCVSSHSM